MGTLWLLSSCSFSLSSGGGACCVVFQWVLLGWVTLPPIKGLGSEETRFFRFLYLRFLFLGSFLQAFRSASAKSKLSTNSPRLREKPQSAPPCIVQNTQTPPLQTPLNTATSQRQVAEGCRSRDCWMVPTPGSLTCGWECAQPSSGTSSGKLGAQGSWTGGCAALSLAWVVIGTGHPGSMG